MPEGWGVCASHFEQPGEPRSESFCHLCQGHALAVSWSLWTMMDGSKDEILVWKEVPWSHKNGAVLLYLPPRLDSPLSFWSQSPHWSNSGLGFLMLNFSHVDLFNVSQRTNSRKLPGIRIFKWNKSISVNNFSRHYERTLPPSDRWEKCIWSFYFSCRYFSLGHHQFRPDLFLQPTNRFSLSLVLHLGMPSLLLPELFFLTLSFVCSEDHSVPHHSQDKE